MLKVLAILGVLGLVIGCGGEPRTTEADRASIDSLRAEHVVGVNGRDADLVLRGMSDNVVYLGPELAPVVGLEALGAIIRPAYEELDPDITMTPQEVTVDRPHAFEWGCLGGVIRPSAGGDPITNEGKYLFLYRWAPGVGWKITHDVYNAGPCP